MKPTFSLLAALLLSLVPLGRARAEEHIRRHVYRLYPAIDASVIAVGALTVAIPYAFPSAFITPRCPCDPAEVNALDRHVIGYHSRLADTFSDVSLGIALAMPVVLDTHDVGLGSEWARDTVVYFEAMMVNGALVTIAKYATQRPLPIVYEGRALVHDPAGYRSFYSGHTSNAVAALTVASMTYTRRHGDTWWPWAGTAVFGLSVAAERVLAGRHFYSDVAVGFAAGWLVGWAVPKLHEVSRWDVAVVPLADGGLQLELGRAF